MCNVSLLLSVRSYKNFDISYWSMKQRLFKIFYSNLKFIDQISIRAASFCCWRWCWMPKYSHDLWNYYSLDLEGKMLQITPVYSCVHPIKVCSFWFVCQYLLLLIQMSLRIWKTVALKDLTARRWTDKVLVKYLDARKNARDSSSACRLAHAAARIDLGEFLPRKDGSEDRTKIILSQKIISRTLCISLMPR